MRPGRRAAMAMWIACVAAACGSRTGLNVPDPSIDASVDGPVAFDAFAPDVRPDVEAGRDVRDAPPLIEGGPLDAQVECATPTYCDPADRDYIYKCGVRVFRCSSVEQCELRAPPDAGLDASCVNPCQDTLGQDTSNGCELYAIPPDVTTDVAGACFAVFVVNQWPTGEPARLAVDRGGVGLPIEQFARIPTGAGQSLAYAPYVEARGLGRGEVAVLFLSRDPAAANDPSPTNPRRLAGCPPGVTPAFVGDAALHGTGRGRAFHVTANVPVVAYSVMPFGAGRARATGASLVLPTNAWDVNYVAVNGWRIPQSFVAPATLAVVAKDDNTVVRVRPTAAIAGGGGIPASPALVSVSYTLARGEYLQLTQDAELSGSAIEASSPVAVLGGNTLMQVPVGRSRADSSHQYLPPVRALGSEYVAVRYRSRARPPAAEESVPWRIVGVVDGTQLSYEPGRPPGAPLALGAGQVAEFESATPFVVRSQGRNAPFYMASYMTGGEPHAGEGDPEFVNVVPPAQYLPQYTFFTDATYPETNLVVVRVKDDATGLFPQVFLDCAGFLTAFTPVGTSGRYEFARVDLSTGNFVGQNGCDNGVHRIAANGLIGLTVWGWGNPLTEPPNAAESDPRFTRWVSYGYPGGANLSRLNDVTYSAR